MLGNSKKIDTKKYDFGNDENERKDYKLITCSKNNNNNNNDKEVSRRLNRRKDIALNQPSTFTVLGPFNVIKEALKTRNWVEKCRDDVEGNRANQHNNKQIEDVDFLWTMRNEPLKWGGISKKTVVSRFPKADFTTKVGLCEILQQTHWYNEREVSEINFPRCYNVCNGEEYSAFAEDFKITACVALIAIVRESRNSEEIFGKYGKVPHSCFKFAANRCYEFVANGNKSFDNTNDDRFWQREWNRFLNAYYSIVHDGGSFVRATEQEIQRMRDESEDILDKLKGDGRRRRLRLDLDGTRNMWILKPAAKSRGRGIQILTKLDQVLAKRASFQSHSRDCGFVVQKYIEKPLLIYETKFDIRQWFLVTSARPLTVWMYRESYLRFCSQTFSLANIHESVHLSNNAVQCKYKNESTRNRDLPDENMWDCYTFQAYLRWQEKSDVWENVIYPGMRKNIVGTLLASQAQDGVDSVKNSFELFGADFVLGRDFVPWLIEINSGPSMSPSTSVTARLCAQVLEDTIKVVVDRNRDKNADTGMFELAYKQVIPQAQPYMGQNLVVRGVRMRNKSERGRAKNAKVAKVTPLEKLPDLYELCGKRRTAFKHTNRKSSRILV